MAFLSLTLYVFMDFSIWFDILWTVNYYIEESQVRISKISIIYIFESMKHKPSNFKLNALIPNS